MLFAGNALATHDIEQALFGTSLGVHLDRGDLAEAGHEHHLRAINRIRRAGGIRQAVEQGVLTSGIMYECVRQGVDFLLAGSIRDDGPLPDVITDVLEAQRQMRAKIRDISFCLMIATTLHSIAVGNLLPAWVKVVCVDINPSTVIKLNDRGSFQTVGLVTDVEPFLRALGARIGSSWSEADRDSRRIRKPRLRRTRSRIHDRPPAAYLDVPARPLRNPIRDQSVDEPAAAIRPPDGGASMG